MSEDGLLLFEEDGIAFGRIHLVDTPSGGAVYFLGDHRAGYVRHKVHNTNGEYWQASFYLAGHKSVNTKHHSKDYAVNWLRSQLYAWLRKSQEPPSNQSIQRLKDL